MYKLSGISKQALHQYQGRQKRKGRQSTQFFEQASRLRKHHPGLGCRQIALALRCPGWGRDKMESWLLNHGYRISRAPDFSRTTYRQREHHYPNLIEGMQVKGIGELVQTDITYIQIGSRFYYLTFIVDVYSRYIGGYAISQSLHATANVRALRMFLKQRPWVRGMIHHSDKGSQYISRDYLGILKEHGMQISMCDEAWENAYSERVNRTIKEEYLQGWRINNYEELKQKTVEAINHYNAKRKHRNLEGLSPKDYEAMINQLSANKRPIMNIYSKPN